MSILYQKLRNLLGYIYYLRVSEVRSVTNPVYGKDRTSQVCWPLPIEEEIGFELTPWSEFSPVEVVGEEELSSRSFRSSIDLSNPLGRSDLTGVPVEGESCREFILRKRPGECFLDHRQILFPDQPYSYLQALIQRLRRVEISWMDLMS